MSVHKYLLDFGHGGINPDGEYVTKGKQYHFTQENISIYEGDINRKIGYRVARNLKRLGIDFEILTPGYEDYRLSWRVAKANRLYSQDKRCVYLSFHSNAVSNSIEEEGSNATGYEIFTSVGQTKSDRFAEVFLNTYIKHFRKTVRARLDNSDGDKDKEAQFYVLRKTHCPALLLENLFYDNLAEAKYLLSNKGQDELANIIIQSIINCEQQIQ